MAAGLDVDVDDVAACVAEGLELAVGLLNHEVDIHGDIDGLADRGHEEGSQGDYGHEAAVHHVEVDVVGAAGSRFGDLLGEPADVGR